MAPNAQLLIMKVTSPDGSILDSTILAALEDAVLLGVDAVNMSLGASAGFADTEETAVQDAYYRCAQAGVSLMIAAGNDMNSAVGNRYGNSLPLAESRIAPWSAHRPPPLPLCLWPVWRISKRSAAT